VKVLGKYLNLSIRIVLTKSAGNILAGQSSEQPFLDNLIEYDNVDGIYHDDDEWDRPWIRKGEILHIEL
jgi:phosphopantothenoylcysteine decarboxylase